MSLGYDAAALAAEGDQLRYRGETPGAYKRPLSELRSWARHNAAAKAAVHALTHHGWHSGGTQPCSDTSSRAHDLAAKAVRDGELPGECFSPGERVGSQIVACMTVLRALGAPKADLDELWRCYGGVLPSTRGASDDALAESGEMDDSEMERLRSWARSGNFAVPDKYVSAKTRGSAQELFASMVKPNYGWKCALTGNATRSFLVASHIVPWGDDEKIRLDPANGICLSTFIDRAFDTGYLTIREDYSVQIDWSRVGADQALRSALAPYDGERMTLPTIAPPNPEFLRRRLNQA